VCHNNHHLILWTKEKWTDAQIKAEREREREERERRGANRNKSSVVTGHGALWGMLEGE